ncbi:MAG: hypothetical protein JWN32_2250 [Solirubrobacterales bacterium]|nr:hypothetical protein [Solirubrobacterales bacterium]
MPVNSETAVAAVAVPLPAASAIPAATTPIDPLRISASRTQWMKTP